MAYSLYYIEKGVYRSFFFCACVCVCVCVPVCVCVCVSEWITRLPRMHGGDESYGKKLKNDRSCGLKSALLSVDADPRLYAIKNKVERNASVHDGVNAPWRFGQRNKRTSTASTHRCQSHVSRRCTSPRDRAPRPAHLVGPISQQINE